MRKEDKFVNMAFAKVTESAINTMTFSEIQTGVSLFDKVAWVIHMILWHPSKATVRQVSTDSDGFSMGLTVSNKISSIDMSDPAVIDVFDIFAHGMGTPATGMHSHRPFVRDFTHLPGGGLIVPPKPVYLVIQGESLAAVGIAEARIYFTHRELSTEDYWELVEARRMVE